MLGRQGLDDICKQSQPAKQWAYSLPTAAKFRFVQLALHTKRSMRCTIISTEQCTYCSYELRVCMNIDLSKDKTAATVPLKSGYTTNCTDQGRHMQNLSIYMHISNEALSI